MLINKSTVEYAFQLVYCKNAYQLVYCTICLSISLL